jgi:26S proteasome regulatory subunit N5
MTKNSFSEISNLKSKIFKKIRIDFTWKKINIVSKKKKDIIFEKFFQKNIYKFIENYLEDFSFMLFFQMIVHFVYFPKINISSVNLILKQIIEFIIKNIFFIYLENNLKILLKITKGKIANGKFSLKINSFLDLIEDSKGKLNKGNNETNSKKISYSEIVSYEDLQEYIETLRIKLDRKKIETSEIIMNQILSKNCMESNYSNIKICLYQQLIRLFHFSQNFNLIIILYFSKLLNFFTNSKSKKESPRELFLITIYLTFIEKSEKNFKLFYCLLFKLAKKYYNSINWILKNLLNTDSNWFYFKTVIFSQFSFLSIFLENSNFNIIKHMRANYIKNNIIRVSKYYKSLNIFCYSLKLDLDYKDTEHWLHELINSKKIKAKIDRIRGIVYFNIFN